MLDFNSYWSIRDITLGVQAREVYSKELKGSISAIASLQGHLLVAIGPKIILHSWNGSELNGAAFFDAPLYVVSLNIVRASSHISSYCCLFGFINTVINFCSLDIQNLTSNKE